jgi:class 3 adenylate cyclase
MPTASGAVGRERRAAPLPVAAIDDELDVLFSDQSDEAERFLAAVMFTDIARSTGPLPALDEHSWPELVREYSDIVGRQAVRYNGRVERCGDGEFVRFSGAYAALRCALAIRQDLRDLGLDLRAGLHAGECKTHDPDVTRVVAHVANRICCVADSGRVLTSHALADLVTGSALIFEEAGTYRLGDVPGQWQLLAVHD